jgi:hypothetical protein
MSKQKKWDLRRFGEKTQEIHTDWPVRAAQDGIAGTAAKSFVRP